METRWLDVIARGGSVAAEMRWSKTSHVWPCKLVLARETPQGLFCSTRVEKGVCVAALFDDGSWTTLCCNDFKSLVSDGRLRPWEQAELNAADAMCQLIEDVE